MIMFDKAIYSYRIMIIYIKNPKKTPTTCIYVHIYIYYIKYNLKIKK